MQKFTIDVSVNTEVALYDPIFAFNADKAGFAGRDGFNEVCLHTLVVCRSKSKG